MKKISRRNFLKVSGAMAAAGALAACGGSGASTPAASGAASTSTAASAAAAGEDKFASLGDFTMTVGHAQPEGNPRFVSMEQFAADVAEATNGHVKIEVYGNGQLGTEKEMLEQVVAGTVQGMRGGQFDFSPRLLMFTLPFLTNTRAQVTALLQSDLAQKVCAEAEGETGTVIIETFKDKSPDDIPAVLVHSHGPFTWGTDPMNAVHNAVVLEELAFMAWHNLVLDPTIPPMQQELLDKHYLRKHGANAYYGQGK